MSRSNPLLILAAGLLLGVTASCAKPDGRPALQQAEQDWRRLHTASALRGFEQAAEDPQVAADAHLGIGRIRAFRGWQAEGAFPGWHEEVDQREPALAAYRRAAELRPEWAEPHVAIGEALLLDGRTAEAAAAFDRALALTPGHPAATRGKQRAEGGADPEAQAIAAMDTAIKTSPAEAVRLAREYLARTPEGPRALDAHDRLLAAYAAWPEAPAADVLAAIDARLAARPDPWATFAAANLLLSKRIALERVRELAEAGAAEGERVITENESSYKLDGKVRNSRDRNRAAAADLIGWAAFLQGDRALAAEKLEEAARLTSGTDAVNQFHRAELARAEGDLDRARERYYDALSLQAGPAPMRAAGREALLAIYLAEATPPAKAEETIARELDRRREERHRALVASAIGKPLPPLPTTSVTGTPVDLLAERGNVTLLNFFASW